jgi:hypothetical protein
VTTRTVPADRHQRARFRRLARLREHVHHPALVPMRHVHEHAAHPVLIMDVYPDRTFGQLLDDETPLDPQRVVELLAPVASGLDAAADRGLVHQTLGADNLLVAESDRLVLDSFGVFVEATDIELGLAQPGDLRYRSPEQLRGLPLEPPANVYSLTALVVHALTGSPPYTGERPAVAYAHLVARPPVVSERVSWLGTEFDDLVARGLAKDPSARPGSATRLVRELREAVGGDADGSDVPATRVSRRAIPRRLAAAVAAAAACGAIVAVATQPFGNEHGGTAGRSAVAGSWDRLDLERTQARAALAAARTPGDQAAAAERLAAAYRKAARAVGTATAARLRAAAAAYDELAAAARSGDGTRFTAARSAANRAEARLQSRQ